VVGHPHDRNAGASGGPELGEDRGQVGLHARELEVAAGRFEQAARGAARPVEAPEVVCADVDRHEPDVAAVALKKRHRRGELRSLRVEAVVAAECRAADDDRRRLAAVAHRDGRLAAAAELDQPQVLVVVAHELEQRVGVPVVVAGEPERRGRAADRLIPLRKRIPERDVVPRLARGRTRRRDQSRGERGEQ
jgi:hypothetical protein